MAAHESKFLNAPLIGSVEINENVSVETILSRAGKRYTVEDDTAQFWIWAFRTMPEQLGETPTGSVSPRVVHAHRRLTRNANFTMTAPQMDGASFDLPANRVRIAAATTVLTDSVSMRSTSGSTALKAGTFVNLGTTHTKLYMVCEDYTLTAAQAVKVYPSVRAVVTANNVVRTAGVATVGYDPEASRRIRIDGNILGAAAVIEERL